MVQHPELETRMFLDVPRKQGDTSSADALIARFVQQFKSFAVAEGYALTECLLLWPADSPKRKTRVTACEVHRG